MTSPGDGYVVLANGRAGTAQREAVDAAVGVLAEHRPARVRHTESLAELDAAVTEADGDVVTVVAGGDGSLHCVVQRLWDAGRLDAARLALVPLGTGNDLARYLGIPMDPVEAARGIVAGTARRLDLLVDDRGGVVVNAVHAGLGAEAAEKAADRKSKLGPLAYPIGAVLAAVRTDGWELGVEVDGAPLTLPDRVLMIGVANGPTIGGGTPVCPGAVPDDGVVDVMVSCAVGASARAGFGLALRKGNHVERDDVVLARGTTVRIRGDAIGHDADGELQDGVTDRTWTLQPAAWSLLV